MGIVPDTVVADAQEYLRLGEEIKALEAKRKEIQQRLSTDMDEGTTVLYNDHAYKWIKYERSSVSWKSLYADSFQLLDDEGQVIMGEKENKSKKVTTHHKFDKM